MPRTYTRHLIDEVLDALQHAGPMSTAELCRYLSRNTNSIHRCLRVLRAEDAAYKQGRYDESMDQGPSEFEGWERDNLQQRITELESVNAAFARRQEWWNERMVALEAELAKCRADALRYRWLRDCNDWYNEPRIEYADGTKFELCFYSPLQIKDQSDSENLDNAIDAARRGKGEV